MGQPTPA
jgi:hypothetical protein